MILSLAPDELGLVYPIIIGTPGVVSSSVSSGGWCTGSQGVWVDHRQGLSHGTFYDGLTLVVAGHHVAAESIYLNNDTDTGGYRFYVKNGFDRNGHPVAFCPWWATKPASADPYEWDAAPTYTWHDPTSAPIGSLGHNFTPSSFRPNSGEHFKIYAGWLDDDNAGAGGLIGKDGATMRGAADVMEYVLGFTSVPVDLGRFAAARPLLNAFKLDFCIDAQVQPWKYLQINVLPLLPCSIVSGPDGVYPIVWRYDATSADAICHFDTGVDPTVERIGRVEYDRGQIVNDLSFQYAYSRRTGGYMGEIRLTDDGRDGSTPDFYCKASVGRYKKADGKPLIRAKAIKSFCVYSTSTAYAMASWMSRAFSLARRRIIYMAPEFAYSHVSRGDVVTLTDAEMHFANQVALVESIRTDGSGYLRFQFLLVEDPVRDARLGQAGSA